MKKILKHIERWNVWRKSNNNGITHKILVLFGIIKSPTFYCAMTKEEAKAVYDGFMEGLKDEMSIDDVIHELESITRFYKNFWDTDDYDNVIKTHEIAIDTMRKYQKIEEIVSNYGFDTSWLCLKKIRKVLEDE